MKALSVVVALFFSQFVSADPACMTLANHLGRYQLQSKTCDSHMFGDHLDIVEGAEMRAGTYTRYWLLSAGTGFGPSTRYDVDLNTCTQQGTDVEVYICGLDRNHKCQPRKGRVSYAVTKDKVVFNAYDCTAVYTK